MEDFQDIFAVQQLDPDGKKYDKVSRIEAQSEKQGLFMLLDVHTEIYPIGRNEKLVVLLTETLNVDGTSVTGYKAQGKQSKADKFEYIMHGKLYKMIEADSERDLKTEIYISFGGLQLMLRGSPDFLGSFQLDQNYFLCLRKLV